jgi:uncharacterized protein (TIGR00369 family)
MTRKMVVRYWRMTKPFYMMLIILRRRPALMDDPTAPTSTYGIVPMEVLASMAGIDLVRGVFAGTLPQPPIMQTVEPFDCTADPGIVVMHSVPAFRHYNPIGSVHGGYAATLLDSAMGLAVHSQCPAGTGYTTLEFKVSFIRPMTKGTGTVRTEGRTLSFGRRAATAEAKISDAASRLLAQRHHNLPGVRISEGNVNL